MSDTLTFRRTGKEMWFGETHIGSLFFAHGRFWVRTDTEAACEFNVEYGNNAAGSSCCNFMIDGRHWQNAPAKNRQQWGEKVEVVEIVK